jgi:hypothetical protein
LLSINYYRIEELGKRKEDRGKRYRGMHSKEK